MTLRFPVKLSPGSVKPNLQRVLENVHLILKGGINHGGIQGGTFSPGTQSIKGHTDSVHVRVLFNTPGNSDVTVTHNLGRIPSGYRLASTNNPAQIYNGSVQPTTTQITLRASLGANPATVVLEIY